MNFTLLIWEMVPEYHELYLIPNDVADKYRAFLNQAHNQFINSDPTNDGMDFLNAALCETDSNNGLTEPWIQYAGIFSSFKQDTKNPIHLMNADTLITSVYLSGFIL